MTATVPTPSSPESGVPTRVAASDPSLERTLRLRLLLVLVLVFAVLLALLHIAVTTLTHDFVRSRLQHDGESLISGLSRDTAEQPWQLQERALPGVYQRAQSGHYFIVRSQQQVLRSRSLWDLEVSVPLLTPGEGESLEMAPLKGQYWLVWQQGFRKGGTDFTLWIAEDISPLRAIQQRFELYLLGLVMLTIPILLLWQGLILRRGFAQLEPLRQALAEQRAGHVANLPDRVPQEVRPLVNAINQQLSRSAEQIQRSRVSLGNLAHELKRPLQQLRWMAEQCSDDKLRSELEGLHDSLFRRIDAELRRARIAGTPMPGQRCNPREEVPHLVQLLDRISARSIRFSSELPDGSIPYDRDDILELLGNLLDNAWRHAHSRVRLTIRQQLGFWTLRVDDDGAGVSEEDLALLSVRGTRLDEQIDGGKGHGLGLSICLAVAQSYGGRLEFSRSALGGMAVNVVLPVDERI